jgi:hypothetical protein
MDDTQMIHIPIEGGELFSDDLDLISHSSDEICDRNIAPVQDQEYQQRLDTIADIIDAAIREQHALYIWNYQNSKRKPIINPQKSPETFLYLHAEEHHYDIIRIVEQHCAPHDLLNMINKNILKLLRLKSSLFNCAINASVKNIHEYFTTVTPHTLDTIDEATQCPSISTLQAPLAIYIMENAKHQYKTKSYWLQGNLNSEANIDSHNLYLCGQAIMNATQSSLPFLYGSNKYKQLDPKQKDFLEKYFKEQENILSIRASSTKHSSKKHSSTPY